MKELILILITGLLCITILEGIALVMGVDGNFFGLAIAGISGLTGIGLDHFYKKYKLKMRFERDLKKNYRIP